MKQLLLIFLPVFFFLSCKSEIEIDEKYVISKFQENADRINSLEYRVHRIDSFRQGGVWNNTGVALIERDSTDEVFGFSFYAKRDDLPEEYLYDGGNGFRISGKDKTYEIEPAHYGLLGSPGGQMISLEVFSLDTLFEEVTLIENEQTYLLKYTFDDDTLYDVTDRVKTIELNKENFFPIRIKKSYNQLGYRIVSQSTLSDIKINDKVQNSIDTRKNKLRDFELIQSENRTFSRLLNKKVPEVRLPNILEPHNRFNLRSNRLTLIDFWEVWCGPCIASFPKVENLKNNYSADLDVLGIVSDNPEDAVKLIEKKGITYLNLVGNDEVKKAFGVDSWPRYFLVDMEGIVQKEYFGFSDEIEKDIQRMLGYQD